MSKATIAGGPVFTMSDPTSAREKVAEAIADASVAVLREAIVDGLEPKPRIVGTAASGSQFGVALSDLVRQPDRRR